MGGVNPPSTAYFLNHWGTHPELQQSLLYPLLYLVHQTLDFSCREQLGD